MKAGENGNAQVPHGAWSMHQLRAAARPWPKKRSSFPWHALSLASLPCEELRLLSAAKLNWS